MIRNPGGSIRYQKIKLLLKKGKNHIVADVPQDTRNTGPDDTWCLCVLVA